MQYIWLWIICLFFAGLFIYQEAMQNHGAAVVLKGLASLTFVILGFLGAKISADSQLAHHVLTGLCLGLVADVLLNLRFVFDAKRGRLVFLVGILVFLTGHIFYIVALIPRCSSLASCIVVGVVVTIALIAWIFSQITAQPAFKIFGVFYIGAIVIMTSISFGILINSPSAFSGIFAAGALLFLASDIILILNTFGGRQRESMRVANLVLYYLGQLLIASSLQFV